MFAAAAHPGAALEGRRIAPQVSYRNTTLHERGPQADEERRRQRATADGEDTAAKHRQESQAGRNLHGRATERRDVQRAAARAGEL